MVYKGGERLWVGIMGYKYYAVKRGREVGLFDNWDMCKKAVWACHPRAWYKGFHCIREASLWFMNDDEEDVVEVVTYQYRR